MAKKPEAKFVAQIHKHVDSNLVWYQSLYTPFSAGTPDYFYSGIADCLFVEYKWQGHLPQRIHLCNPEIKHPLLTPKQQNWLNGRYYEGRNVAVVYGCPEGAIIFEAMSWENPMDQEVFRVQCVDAKSIADWIVEKTSLKCHTKKKEPLPI